MNLKSVLFNNFKPKFWGIFGGLVVYALGFIFVIIPNLGITDSIGLYFLFLTIYFLPALWLMLLGLYSLFTAHRGERTWLKALGYLFIALVTGVMFVPFFLLVTISVFGFS